MNDMHLAEQDLPDLNQSTPGRLDKVLRSIKEFATVSEVLRIFGAAIMVASMSVFLLQGWSEGNDIQRYLKLLTQTGLLAAGGFLLSYLLREYKGARLFFGLALLSVPANFTILGGLIYSLFLGSGISPQYPQFASWIVSDSISIGWVLAGAMAVLIPVTLLGLNIMARRSARPLSITFLMMNALLLIPLRDSWVVGGMLVAAILIPGWVMMKRYFTDPTLATGEGRYALLLLLVPAGLLLGRNLFLYQLDVLLGFMACTSLYVASRQYGLLTKPESIRRKLTEGISVPLAYAGAFCLADLVQRFASVQVAIGAVVMLLGGFMLDYTIRASHSTLKPIILTTTSLIISAVMLNNLIINDSAISAILGFAGGTGLSVFGIKYKNRLILIAGIVTGLGAILFGLKDVLAMLIQSSWLGLAVVGGMAIVGASLLDRYGAVIKLRISNWSAAMSNKS